MEAPEDAIQAEALILNLASGATPIHPQRLPRDQLRRGYWVATTYEGLTHDTQKTATGD